MRSDSEPQIVMPAALLSTKIAATRADVATVMP
jgi:hypothetical protein